VKVITQTIDILEQAFLIRRLQPWFVNISKRVIKSPKFYYRDSGNLHYLSNIFDYDSLLRNKLIGHSWEGYVIEQICNTLHNSVKPYFYRTSNGAETDLVLVKGITPIVAIEIKLSSANSLTKGSTEAINDLKTEHNFIVTTEGGNYFTRPEWKVCNLEEIMVNLANLGLLSKI
jgi:predicted AAA+ superfamily ATPase